WSIIRYRLCSTYRQPAYSLIHHPVTKRRWIFFGESHSTMHSSLDAHTRLIATQAPTPRATRSGRRFRQFATLASPDVVAFAFDFARSACRRVTGCLTV